MTYPLIDINEEKTLLMNFNDRVDIAFTSIYTMYGKEFNIFSATLFGYKSQQAEDLVEEAFINLWLSKSKFDNIKSLKAYLYVSIKNGYFRHREHNKHIEKYEKMIYDNYDFEACIIESQVYSFVDETLKILPELYADVIRRYIEGWKPAEIAEALNRSEESIYKIKWKAIQIIRGKLSNDKLLLFISLIK